MLQARFYIVIAFLTWSLTTMSQSHEFEIRGFHLNETELIAAYTNIQDLNGKTTALIRFAVRDTLFSFDANNGIVEQKKEIGEVLLFVPDGTKSITIRHPYLGVLRDYMFPTALRSERTYDAEIVITNADYLRKIMGYEQQFPFNDIPEKQERVYEERPRVEYPLIDQPQKVRTPIETHFLIGAGFNALSVMGPSASIGLEIGNFFVGADFVYGIDKVKNVGINYKKGSQTTLGEAYDYSASRASLRIGMNFMTGSTFQVVPQVGASMSFISGSAISGIKGIDTQFEKSTPISAFLALSLRVKLGETFLVHVTPQYDFAVSADDVYKVIKEADSKIKAWGEGFGVCAGVTLRF